MRRIAAARASGPGLQVELRIASYLCASRAPKIGQSRISHRTMPQLCRPASFRVSRAARHRSPAEAFGASRARNRHSRFAVMTKASRPADHLVGVVHDRGVGSSFRMASPLIVVPDATAASRNRPGAPPTLDSAVARDVDDPAHAGKRGTLEMVHGEAQSVAERGLGELATAHRLDARGQRLCRRPIVDLRSSRPPRAAGHALPTTARLTPPRRSAPSARSRR